MTKQRRIAAKIPALARCMTTAAAAAALAAAFGLLSVVGERAAWAQCGPTVIDGTDGGILHGSFGAQTLAISSCAPGIIRLDQGSTYTEPPYDSPSYGDDVTDEDRLRDGFSYTFDVRPCDLAGGSDLPGAKLTLKYIPPPSMLSYSEQMVMTLAPDKDKPTLNTTSTPRKGTKVKPGDTIKVRMEASEEYNNPRWDWQTGVKKLQLTDESRNQVVPPHFEGSQMRPCSQKQWNKELEVTYTVPRDPPPIIRLRALAEDFAGNQDDDLGEFPTKGDWYGSIDWWIPTPAGRQWGRLGLTLDYDGQGNLKGQMTGDDNAENQLGPSCRMITKTPSKLSANLLGQYTPGRNTMSLRIADQKFEQGQYSLVGCGSASGGTFGGGGPLGQPALAQLLNSLTVRSDGSVKAGGEGPVIPASSVPTTLHLKLALHRTQN